MYPQGYIHIHLVYQLCPFLDWEIHSQLYCRHFSVLLLLHALYGALLEKHLEAAADLECVVGGTIMCHVRFAATLLGVTLAPSRFQDIIKDIGIGPSFLWDCLSSKVSVRIGIFVVLL